MTRKKGKTTHNVMASKKIPIKLNAVRRSKEFMWWSVEIMFSFFYLPETLLHGWMSIRNLALRHRGFFVLLFFPSRPVVALTTAQLITLL
jgi:hypothetical protein